MTSTHQSSPQEKKTITRPEVSIPDAIEQLRTAAQDLHKVVSDAAAKRGKDIKAAFHAVPEQTQALIKSVQKTVERESGPTKKHLAQAVAHLEALQKETSAILESAAKDLRASTQQALAGARSTVQQLSEAVAGKRGHSATPAKPVTKNS
jgi:hypothetical protein